MILLSFFIISILFYNFIFTFIIHLKKIINNNLLKIVVLDNFNSLINDISSFSFYTIYFPF